MSKELSGLVPTMMMMMMMMKACSVIFVEYFLTFETVEALLWHVPGRSLDKGALIVVISPKTCFFILIFSLNKQISASFRASSFTGLLNTYLSRFLRPHHRLRWEFREIESPQPLFATINPLMYAHQTETQTSWQQRAESPGPSEHVFVLLPRSQKITNILPFFFGPYMLFGVGHEPEPAP